ncbi:MAG: MSMEG_1061 family FMN-dependent PPOX-type flavoprotein [Paracoccaceae bacterium]
MDFIQDINALEVIYSRPPSDAAMRKVARRLTPQYAKWIEASRFCVVSTVGPEGADGSPRGDEGPVVRALDPGTLAMPDWRGNNRVDTLRNIVRDGRIALLFLVPGSRGTVRVNGRAKLTADADLCKSFARGDAQPSTVIVIEIEEIYIQCARAIMRSALWESTVPEGLPSFGDIIDEITQGEIDGASFDQEWPARARESMW